MDNLNLDEAKDKILEAITKQRWFFFENKSKVLMDKLTGILWANLDYFPYMKDSKALYKISEAKFILKHDNKFFDWSIPNKKDLFFIYNNEFPFYEKHDFNKGYYWLCNNGKSIKLGVDTEWTSLNGRLLPCNYSLVEKTNYQDKISNNSYTSKEKAQFTLELFLKNSLIPIFNNKEITALYKKAYIEKSLVQVTKQVINTPVNFNYTDLLSKYNLTEIDKSVIKYYQSVSQWLNELLDNLDGFEQQKQNIISEFKISLLNCLPN